jgi:hypothetical protein
MKKDFTIPNEVASRIIDFLYDVKSDGKGWIRDEAKSIIAKLEEVASEEKP